MVTIEIVFVNYFIYFVSQGTGVGHFLEVVQGNKVIDETSAAFCPAMKSAIKRSIGFDRSLAGA